MASEKAIYWLALAVFALGLSNSYEQGNFARVHQIADHAAMSVERAAENGLSKLTMAEVMMGWNPARVARLQGLLARLEAREAWREAQADPLEAAQQQLQAMNVQLQNLKSAAAAWKCHRHETHPASATQDHPEVAEVQIEAAQQRVETLQQQAEADRERAQQQAEANREAAAQRAEADREQAEAQAEFNREQAEAARENAREQRVEMQVSRFVTPEIHVQVPEVQVPAIEIPTIHVPEVRVPAIHVRVPRVDVRVPQFTARPFMVNDTTIDLSGIPGIDSFKTLDCPRGQMHIHVQTDKPHTTI